MHPSGALLLLVGEENPVAAALGAERVVVGVEHEGTAAEHGTPTSCIDDSLLLYGPAPAPGGV